MPCMENIEAKGIKRERPKCPTCKKVLKYEQNYIENKHVKPLEKTHTIVMAHNLNILHYIYKKFVCKNLASVGYYIGGGGYISYASLDADFHHQMAVCLVLTIDVYGSHQVIGKIL